MLWTLTPSGNSFHLCHGWLRSSSPFFPMLMEDGLLILSVSFWSCCKTNCIRAEGQQTTRYCMASAVDILLTSSFRTNVAYPCRLNFRQIYWFHHLHMPKLACNADTSTHFLWCFGSICFKHVCFICTCSTFEKIHLRFQLINISSSMAQKQNTGYHRLQNNICVVLIKSHLN